MPHHFRDRVIYHPYNIPQLPSGLVTYEIGSYRITLSHQSLDANAGAFTQANGTANVFDAQYAINITEDLDPNCGAFTQVIGATSP